MADQGETRKPRASSLRWVRLGDLKVHPKAQREYRPAHAESLASEFEIEAMGFPVVNVVDGRYWVLDGQHRIAALHMVGFADDDQIQCECYEGLTEPEMAELFLLRDTRKSIGAFDKFKIAIVAGREMEVGIEQIVHANDLRIAQGAGDRTISAVNSLQFAYRLGPDTLARTLKILNEAYDGARDAFSANLIKGVSLVCQRYNGSLEDEHAAKRLSVVAGGPAALERKATALRLKTGHAMPHCTAAATVEVLNSGRGGKKLESWWS